MKKKIVLIIMGLSFIAFTIPATSVFATDAKAPATLVAEKAAETGITGIVEKTETGIVINAADGKYVVTGQDLSALEGKTVKAMGNVTEVDGQKTIEVTVFEEAK